MKVIDTYMNMREKKAQLIDLCNAQCTSKNMNEALKTKVKINKLENKMNKFYLSHQEEIDRDYSEYHGD